MISKKDKVAAEGINLAVEQIHELKECPGVRGFHIMAVELEGKVPGIVERAGLYTRPKVNYQHPSSDSGLDISGGILFG